MVFLTTMLTTADVNIHALIAKYDIDIQIVRPEMTKFKMFRDKIFILWELHSKILVGDKTCYNNGQKERLCLIIDKCRRQKLCK